jgi:nucleoside diphosphate kinase
MEQTVIIIKPDVFVIEKRDEYSQLKKELPEADKFIEFVRGKINSLGLSVINERKEQLSREIVAEHYKEHKDNITKFNSILGNMTFWPSYLLLIEWEDSQKLIRTMIEAIREEFLLTPKVSRRNMIHASANLEEAKFESNLHFR